MAYSLRPTWNKGGNTLSEHKIYAPGYLPSFSITELVRRYSLAPGRTPDAHWVRRREEMASETCQSCNGSLRTYIAVDGLIRTPSLQPYFRRHGKIVNFQLAPWFTCPFISAVATGLSNLDRFRHYNSASVYIIVWVGFTALLCRGQIELFNGPEVTVLYSKPYVNTCSTRA